MSTFISAIFLLCLAGIFIVYPMYFYFLYEFKKLLNRNHPEVWSHLGSKKSDLQTTYRALHLSKSGNIDHIQLAAEVLVVRKWAVRSLYVGMSLFLVVLAIGLFESVKVGKY